MKTFSITLLARTPDSHYKPDFGNISQKKMNISTQNEFHKSTIVEIEHFYKFQRTIHFSFALDNCPGFEIFVNQKQNKNKM